MPYRPVQILLTAIFSQISASAIASETELSSTGWLHDFFAKGIKSAYAEYSMEVDRPVQISDQYYRQMTYSIEYSAEEQMYEMLFVYEYRDNWDVLTRNGAVAPPKQTVYLTGSKIQPWTSLNGVGTYSEKYDRKIPNWMTFAELDSLLMMQLRMGNPLPPMNGLFWEDELKQLKKEFKASGSSLSVWCIPFEFDGAGNVVDVSQEHLASFSEKKTLSSKKLENYTMSIRNNQEDVVFIEVLTSNQEATFLEGLQFRSGDKRCKIFNFELNTVLNKFAPQLVEDPSKLIEIYLRNFQEFTGRSLQRFNITASK